MRPEKANRAGAFLEMLFREDAGRGRYTRREEEGEEETVQVHEEELT